MDVSLPTVRRRPLPWRDRARDRRGDALLARVTTAVACVAAAAAIHLGVVREHLAESVLFGWFFLGLALAQALIAARLVLVPLPSRLFFLGALSINAAAIAIWAVSRSTGLPLGPTPWVPEPTGVLDVLASVYEAAFVILVWRFVADPSTVALEPGRRHARETAVLVLLGILLAGWALSALQGGGDPAEGHTDALGPHGAAALRRTES